MSIAEFLLDVQALKHLWLSESVFLPANARIRRALEVLVRVVGTPRAGCAITSHSIKQVNSTMAGAGRGWLWKLLPPPPPSTSSTPPLPLLFHWISYIWHFLSQSKHTRPAMLHPDQARPAVDGVKRRRGWTCWLGDDLRWHQHNDCWCA